MTHAFLKNTARNSLLLLLIMSLLNCSGWRLRGSDGGTTTLAESSVYLSGASSATYQLIEQQLGKKNSLTSLINAKQQLVLGKEEIERRSASLNRGTSTAEYELTLTIDYQILDSEQQPLRSQTEVRIVRSYSFDENDIAGKDKEEALIRRDMQRAAARQILRQLEFTQP